MNDVGINNLLEKLGLTEYESKTLSTLFKLREAEAPEVSRIAQVPKTRVYDVLDKLIRKKLIIEISGRPKKYRVIPPAEAVDLLVEGKKQEIAELEEKSQQLKQTIANFETKGEEMGENVMKIKDKGDFEKILAQEIHKAKNQVMALTELRDEHQILIDAIAKAKDRNVTIKIVNHSPTEIVKKYAKAGLGIKHCEHGLEAFVIDNKKVILALSDFKADKPEYHLTIWNDHKPMVNAVQHLFDKCWQQGKSV